jgi:hypothetical protein
MNKVFRFRIALLVAIVAVFGGIYLLDTHMGWRPFAGSTRMSEIKGSAGTVSPVENGGGSDLPLRHEDAATGKGQGRIYRCDVNGKTIYADVPCDGPRSRIVETRRPARAQTADPGEVDKYTAQAPAAKIAQAPATKMSAKPKAVPTEPSSVATTRARCAKLEKFIGFLDDRVRQPLSDSELDSIKQEKKIWRQEQSDLDCVHA